MKRWAHMQDNTGENIGIKLLIQQYKQKFETEENINYYAYKDFVKAERKYLKFMLNGNSYTDANLSN